MTVFHNLKSLIQIHDVIDLGYLLEHYVKHKRKILFLQICDNNERMMQITLKREFPLNSETYRIVYTSGFLNVTLFKLLQ